MQRKRSTHPLHLELDVQHFGTGTSTNDRIKKPQLKTVPHLKHLKS